MHTADCCELFVHLPQEQAWQHGGRIRTATGSASPCGSRGESCILHEIREVSLASCMFMHSETASFHQLRASTGRVTGTALVGLCTQTEIDPHNNEPCGVHECLQCMCHVTHVKLYMHSIALPLSGHKCCRALCIDQINGGCAHLISIIPFNKWLKRTHMLS